LKILTLQVDNFQKKLYDLIWKRTIASQDERCSASKRPNVTIDISTRNENFIAKGEIIQFDGFLRVYSESV